MPGTTASHSSLSAEAFLNGLGGDTHVAYTDGGWANIPNLISDLKYLGISQVRDGITNGEYGSAPLASYIEMAKAGIKFSFIIEGSSKADLQSRLDLIDQVAAAVPGSVIGIEGPNEINNQPVTYNGVSGLQGALDLQRDLYAAVHSDPLLAGVPVDYFTGYDAGGVGLGPDPMTTPGLADFDTQHPYPNFGQAPAAWVARAVTLPNTTSATAPAVYTETGYSSFNVSETVQAKYTLDLLFDTAVQGISKTFLYDVMDAYAPGSRQGDDGFGLFDYTKVAKPVAVGIHNLTSLLADNAGATGQLTDLSYSLSGLPSTGNSLVLEKADGSDVLAIWDEPQIWDNATGREIAAPGNTVTVSFAQSYSWVQVFDPLVGTAPIATYNNVSSIDLKVVDHPLLVEVGRTGTAPSTGSTTPTTTTSPDTLVLNVSEDAFAGDAQFNVSVDGVRVGNTQTVTALKGSAGQNFTFAGNFGTGAHTVAVTFLNDAYGGTPTTDRNLYVNSITLNGVTTTVNAAQLSAGEADYIVQGGTATAGNGPGSSPTSVPTSPASGGGSTQTGVLQGALVTYNWDPSTQLRHFLDAEAQVSAGQAGARAKIITLGDSTTRGFGSAATDWQSLSYPAALAASLAKSGVATQADNFLGGSLNVDGRLSLVNGSYWSGATDAGGQVIETASAGAGVDFTLKAAASYDRVDINYIDVGNGSVTVSVDGGAPLATLKFGNTGATLTQTVDIPAGSHSKLSIRAADGNKVYLEGASFWNSTSPSIEVYNAGIGGADSTSGNAGIVDGRLVAGSIKGFGQLAGAAELQPSLALIDYGINDINNGTLTVAQTVSNIAQMITQLRSVNCDPVIVIPQPFDSPAYASQLPALRAALQALAKTQNVPIIDLSATYGDSVAALKAAGLMADNLHPDAALYADIGSKIAALLSSATGSTGVTGTTPGTTTTPPSVTATPSTPVATTPASTPGSSNGSGPDTLVLNLSEDAYQGDAQFTVSVDGVQVGGTQTVTALRQAGAGQTFSFSGSFGAGAHQVAVNFLNDAYGGSVTTDRNLYVNAISLNGATTFTNGAQLMNGAVTYAVTAPTTPIAPAASGPDTLVLSLAEDAYLGDAQFMVSVDGQLVGGVQSVTASHAAGQSQDFAFTGNWGSGAHNVVVNFLNDASGGTAATDRNLYVKAITLNGATTTLNAAQLMGGPVGYTVQAGATAAATTPIATPPAAATPAATTPGTTTTTPSVTTTPPTTTIPASTPGSSNGSGPDTLVLNLSEDAYQGDAQFTVSVDGVQVGGTQTVTALRQAGAGQTFSFSGSFGAGAHQVAVNFLNDAYGGSVTTDRNLYVNAISLNGATTFTNGAQLMNGAVTYAVTAPTTPIAPAASGPDTLVLSLAEDAYLGDAQFMVSVDGQLVGGVQSVTASHAAGQSQDFAFTGNWGSGAHNVVVNFLNDASGGTAATDRNLYVKAITLNGATTTLNAAQLMGGPVGYTVQAGATAAATTPIATPPAAATPAATTPGTTTTTPSVTTTPPTTTIPASTPGPAVLQHALVTYNWDPTTQLQHFLAAETQVAAGVQGARAKIVALGDSTTAGVGAAATDYRRTLSYPGQLTASLVTDGIKAQSANFLGGLPGEDDRISLVGNAIWCGAQAAGGLTIATQAAGSGVDFALTTPGAYDRVDINYIDIGDGQATVSVDGGATLATLKMGHSGQMMTQTVDIPAGLHSSLNLRSTTSNNVFIEGASFWSSTSPSVEIYNAGVPGAASDTVGTGSLAGYGELQGVAALKPSLALIDYGINDINNGTLTVAQTVSNIAQMITQLRSVNCDPVIVIPQPFDSPAYASQLPALRAALQALAKTQNVPIIDLSATYGDSVAALKAAGLMTDNLHPDAALYADIGSKIAALLSNATGSTGVTGTTPAPAATPSSVTATPSTPVATTPASTPGSSNGSGPDTLVLNLSEDAYQGDAQFTVSVDGVQVGGTQTVTALRQAGAGQTFSFSGSFGAGAHQVAVNFLNDAYGGSVTTDRNLYVNAISLNGATTFTNGAQLMNGAVTYAVTAPTTPIAPAASGPDTLVLSLAEDAYLGDAQFMVSVDGQFVGGVQSVTASHAAGQSQDFAFTGNWGSGAHNVVVNFLNDASGGTAATDRNLYVNAITLNGTTTTQNAAQLLSGPVGYTVQAGAAAAGSSTLAVRSGTTLLIENAAPPTLSVAFAGGGGTLQLDDAQDFQGQLVGFSAGCAVDLRSVSFSGAAASPSYAGSSQSGTLTVSNGSQTAHLAMVGNYTGANFHTASDHMGGTLITLA